MQSLSTSNLKKESSVDIKNSCFSLGSLNLDTAIVKKKPKSTKISQMLRKIPQPSFLRKLTLTEDNEQEEELKKEMEAKSESDFKRRMIDSPLYESVDISDPRVNKRQSQFSPFIPSNADISKYPQMQPDQSLTVLPSMSLYSFLPNLLDKRHSSAVDCMGSTSVDGRVPWYSCVKFSSATQRKISSYIDKRFSSVNGRRISQFHGRKKFDKNSFVELQESVSSASANDHRLFTLKSAGYFGKPVKLRNFLDETTYVDTLHIDTFTTLGCNSHRCLGAVKSEFTSAEVLRKREDIISHAMDFLDQFYSSIKKHFTSEHKARAQQVQLSLIKTGTYDLTRYELTFGAKLAWRNAHRCIGRIQWAKLQVFDARGAVTASDMFEALCQHIRYATNKGNIRSTVTIFQQHVDDRDDYRIWNSYLISYAGYLLEDGTLVGDPKNLYFTEECTKLGWLPKYGNFDILPIVVSSPGMEAEWFDIPEDIVLEVQMTHPEYKWFSDLGLKWYALPIISGMKLDCGGVLFTACAFNGWHLSTQIGSRCFCDQHRYNIIPIVAPKMNFSKTALFSTDRIVLEVNVAVLHSFLKANVAITDHHGASDAFLYHLEIEYLVRGGCPADWKYIVPPLTSSTLGVFHQEMLMYRLKPSFEHQEEAWLSYNWKSPGRSDVSISSHGHKKAVLENGRSVVLSLHLWPDSVSVKIKCIILFASETGKSERLAYILRKIFQLVFDVEVLPVSQYNFELLAHESLVLIVTSTHGNGDAPYDAQEFAQNLFEKRGYEVVGNSFYLPVKSYRTYIKLSSVKDKNNLEVNELFDTSDFLQNVRYSIFSLASESYPHFGAFGKYLNNIFNELGAARISPLETGNDLYGLEQSFYKWAKKVYEAACETFNINNDRINDVVKITCIEEHKWNPLVCRLRPVPTETDRELCKKLSYIHQKTVLPCILTERSLLQAKVSSRQTLLIKLNTQNADELEYTPGDLVGIYPMNSSMLVDGIMRKLENSPLPDQVIQVEFLDTESQGPIKRWVPFEKLPPCSLRLALMHFIDLVTPPSQSLLHMLSKLANIGNDKEKLALLAANIDAYEEWKTSIYPNFLEVMNLFPSLKIPAALLLTELPIMHERYYCISSDPAMEVGDLHITVAVLKYRNAAGNIREGVCSGWLNSCDIGTMAPCLIRKNKSFHLPSNKSLPILMIAAGKGIAPFRSFWQHRVVEQEYYSKAAEDEREILGDMTLFFGCRSSALDNIYGKELKSMEKNSVMAFYLAYSKEPNLSKMYVQELLKRRASQVVDIIINKEGHVYVSGDIVKVSDITNALEELLSVDGMMSPTDATKFLWHLKDSGVFHEIIYGFDRKVPESQLIQTLSINTSLAPVDSEIKNNEQEKCCPCVLI